VASIAGCGVAKETAKDAYWSSVRTPEFAFTRFDGSLALLVTDCAGPVSGLDMSLVWASGSGPATTSSAPTPVDVSAPLPDPGDAGTHLFLLHGAEHLVVEADAGAPPPYSYGMYRVHYQLEKNGSGSTTIAAAPIPDYPTVLVDDVGLPEMTTAAEVSECRASD
jgi:hypothetical protein